MDRVEVDTLVETVRTVIRSYATWGYNNAGERRKLYYVENSEEQIFGVVDQYDPGSKEATLILMARIVNEHVVIDEDKTSVSLIGELEKVGIPASQITLAWRSKTP